MTDTGRVQQVAEHSQLSVAPPVGHTGLIPEHRAAQAIDPASECAYLAAGHCYWCCQRCNYDQHRCAGCGAPVRHGSIACADCRARTAAERRDELISELRGHPSGCVCARCSGLRAVLDAMAAAPEVVKLVLPP